MSGSLARASRPFRIALLVHDFGANEGRLTSEKQLQSANEKEQTLHSQRVLAMKRQHPLPNDLQTFVTALKLQSGFCTAISASTSPRTPGTLVQ